MSATDPGFHVTLMIGRRLYWEVRAAGIIEVPEVAREARDLISFDLHDHRLRAPARQSSRQARRAFMREWGEQVRVANRARELGAVYGRDPARALPRPIGCRLHSGLQLMDLLARQRALPLAGRLLGLRLGSAAGPGRRLVLLFAFDAEGELLRFQEAANPPDLNYLVEEFCRGLPGLPEATEPEWFDQSDAMAVLGRLQPYPDEDSWFEIPQRRWWQAGHRLALAASGLALGVSAWAAWDDWQARQLLESARAQRFELQRWGDQALGSHVRAVAWSGSSDLAQAFHDAELLWRPGTRVQVLATPARIDYTLRLAPPEHLEGGIGSSRVWLPHPLRATLDADGSQLPPGVQALDPAIGGDLHAYYLRFRRETPLPPLAALLGAQP